MKEKDINEILKTMRARVDELSKALVDKKGDKSGGSNEIKYNTIVVDMRNTVCMGWAFLGGLALGYAISRKK